MTVLSKNPHQIHDAYKEAVVDSLLNNLSARLAGREEFYRVVYGSKPSAALMSEFIIPMPAEERAADEEADPIRISAHGLDFQVRADAKAARMTVSVKGAVYVRILPTEDEVKPGGRLEATFPLTREARQEIRARVREALSRLATELPGGNKHPGWRFRSQEARKAVYETMDMPFDNSRDRSQVDTEVPEELEDERELSAARGEQGEARPVQEVPVSATLPDHLANDIPPPPKWLRLELELPSFEFTPDSAESGQEGK